MSADYGLDLSLSSVKQGLIELATMIQEGLVASLRSLTTGDGSLAQDVDAGDASINRFRFELEEHCYRVLRAQPLNERELRQVVGVQTVATNLERVADYAADIAYQVRKYPQFAALNEQLEPILQMAEVSQEMVSQSVDAFLDSNDGLAESIVRRDREMDELNEQALFGAMDVYQRDHDTAALMFITNVARDYFRMGERSANICERAIYIATGELKEFRR
jgi:phosphate transport system protein